MNKEKTAQVNEQLKDVKNNDIIGETVNNVLNWEHCTHNDVEISHRGIIITPIDKWNCCTHKYIEISYNKVIF